MATGKVKWYSDEKGYGFVQPDDGGPDVFVHHSVIQTGGYRTLLEGQRVRYESEPDAKGPRATLVAPL